MNRRVWLSAVLVAVAACGAAITAKEVEIKTPTLQCSYCEQTISTAVKNVDGVQAVSVDLDKKVVKVTYAEGATDVAKIESAISKAGYQANGSKADKTAYKSLPDCCKMDAAAH